MKNFKAIIQTEYLSEQDKRDLAEATWNCVNEFYHRNHNSHENNPNLVQIDGKWYDKRYMK